MNAKSPRRNGLTGQPFARHWVHTRFLQVEGKKMSKSLGNFHTVRGLIHEQKVHPLALRLTLISGQYRKPFNFTLATLRDSERLVKRFAEAWKITADSLGPAAGRAGCAWAAVGGSISDAGLAAMPRRSEHAHCHCKNGGRHKTNPVARHYPVVGIRTESGHIPSENE